MTTLATETGVRGAQSRAGLLLSDYWFLCAVAIAVIVTVDPLELGLASDAVLKHLALAMSVPALLLASMGQTLRRASRRARPVQEVIAVVWPLVVLAAVISGGSLYARFVGGIQSTFLNLGLYTLMTVCAAAMVLRTEAPDALVRGYFRILLAAAVVMSAYLIANYGVRQVYHEQIFLVIPMAALFFIAARRVAVRWLGFAFFLSMAWFSHKYTAYLIGAVTVTYLAVAVTFARLRARSALYRVTVAYFTCLAGIVAALIIAYVALHGSADLPTGNPDYRLHTYAAAWDRFKESPLWGTLFAVESVEKFKLFTIGIAENRLPTHSDVLDLLAGGGVLAIVLWLLALARVGQIVFRNLLHRRYLDHPWAPYGHTLALMSLAGVMTYAFNPILLQPSMAYLLWCNLGLLLGLSLRAGQEDRAFLLNTAPR